ncbi:MAG: glycosyltransferase family 1 protein [Planctomycetes bacterium]|nr:glycosyltransferase family 1 protein [Planctomycetota bacterium]
MRITILTTGSRGDVQPYVALGVGLQEVGHEVRLATHGEFASLIQERGLGFSPLIGDPRALLETGEGQELLDSGGNPFRLLRQFVRLAEPMARQCLADSLQACEGAEAVLFSMTACFGHWVAQKLGVPSCAAYLLPVTPTRAMPSTVFPAWPSWLPLGRELYHRFTYFLGSQLLWMPLQRAANHARRDVLDLPPLSLWAPPWRSFPPGFPVIYGFSPTLLPKPADWDNDKHVTGFWFLDCRKEWTAPPELLDFLDSGPPPVYVGFGSMNNRNAEEVAGLVREALGRAGQRGILLTGWGGLAPTNLPDTIFPIESVPHDWLFPRMAAVVHHGGAGTTAAGLRAGVPSVLVPFMSDQPFWARRIFELRAGPKPIPRKRLSADRLEQAIHQAVTDPDLRGRAAELGERIRVENGVEQAVETFHRCLQVERPAVAKTFLFQEYQKTRSRRRTKLPRHASLSPASVEQVD